jgi:amidase
MGRSVTDVAVLLTALVGREDMDYTQALQPAAAHDLRIGVIVFDEAAAEQMARQYSIAEDQLELAEKQLLAANNLSRLLAEVFSKIGMKVVKIDASELPPPSATNALLPYGFRDSLNRFFKNLGKNAPMSSLAEIIRVNNKDLPDRAPYGQSFLTGAKNTVMPQDEYEKIIYTSKTSTADGLGRIFKKHRINALITDSQTYAAAGFPAITVPASYTENGQPFGLVMVGNVNGEADLIRAAFVFEQTVQGRKLPNLDKTIPQIMKLQQ